MDFELIRTKIKRSIEPDARSLDHASIQHLLRERSERLAEEPTEVQRSLAYEVIEIQRASAALGLPCSRVTEIRRVRLCALPHTPPTVSGIFHIRGKASCAIDLQPLVGASTPLEHGDHCLVAMLADPRGQVGLRIDEVIGLRRVYADEIDDDAGLERSDFFAAVTSDLLAIVDVSRLLERREFLMTRPQS